MYLLGNDYITRTYLGEALIQGILTGQEAWGDQGRRAGARLGQEWLCSYLALLGTGASSSRREEIEVSLTTGALAGLFFFIFTTALLGRYSYVLFYR